MCLSTPHSLRWPSGHRPRRPPCVYLSARRAAAGSLAVPRRPSSPRSPGCLIWERGSAVTGGGARFVKGGARLGTGVGAAKPPSSQEPRARAARSRCAGLYCWGMRAFGVEACGPLVLGHAGLWSWGMRASGVGTCGATLPGGAPLLQRDAAVTVGVDLREDLVD